MRPRLTALLALVALVASGCGGEEERAAAPPDRWNAVAAEIAAPWPALQRSNGHFRDYVTRRAPSRDRDDYGDALLGYGLLQRAARTGDARLRDTGLRAIRFALRSRGSTAVAPFRYFAIAAAYNLAKRRFRTAPLFRSARPRWERVMKRLKILRVGRGEVTNKSLVEAVQILELARTGLRSKRRGTILNDPRRSVRLVRRLLGRDLPRAARPFERASGRAGRTAMIGDFTSVPLAYHALASGFLARSIDLLGRRAPARARRLLRRSADASWALAGPDGDVSYWGRSQEQAWTLSLTAYGAETAARQPGGGARAARYRALSTRAVERLDDAYGASREGYAITPAIARDIDAGIKGLDYYVAAASYNGLTLVALDWAIGSARSNRSPGELGADRNGSFRLATRDSTFATVRRGDVWFAVKQAKTAKDLRYDFGLVAVKVRGDDGTWRTLPVRPRRERESDTAGPILRRGGRRGVPEGRRLRVDGRGAVTVTGGYRRGRRWLRRGVRFRFTPTGCGVRLRAPRRAGDAFEYSAFFSAAPTKAPDRVAGAGQELSFGPRASTRVQRGYASDLDPRLFRARMRFARATGATPLSVTTCAR